MTTTAVLAPFEALLNRSLAASTPARALLADLRDRSFAIDVTTPLGGRLLRVRLQTDDARLALTTGEEAADATVSGTPFGLMALLAGRADGRLTASGVSIAGDAEVDGVESTAQKLIAHTAGHADVILQAQTVAQSEQVRMFRA